MTGGDSSYGGHEVQFRRIECAEPSSRVCTNDLFPVHTCSPDVACLHTVVGMWGGLMWLSKTREWEATVALGIHSMATPPWTCMRVVKLVMPRAWSTAHAAVSTTYWGVLVSGEDVCSKNNQFVHTRVNGSANSALVMDIKKRCDLCSCYTYAEGKVLCSGGL